MRKCTKCKIEKDPKQFGKRSASADGLSYRCKECNKVRSKQQLIEDPNKNIGYYNSNKDGYFYIYVLEGLNYVGKTNNLYMRMCRHKSDGRLFDRYTILDRAKSEEEALKIEAQYHAVGYFGRHPKAKN